MSQRRSVGNLSAHGTHCNFAAHKSRDTPDARLSPHFCQFIGPRGFSGSLPLCFVIIVLFSIAENELVT